MRGSDFTRDAGREARPVVPDELARALATLAAENAAPAVSSTPFVSVAERGLNAQQRRRARGRRWLIGSGIAVVGLVALHLVITRVVLRTPRPEALASHAEAIGRAVLPLYSATAQPLRADASVVVFRDRVRDGHLRYSAEVTLRLTQPLYAPATTNGTAAYRQLQAALHASQAQSAELDLFAPGEIDEPPELPLMLQIVQRAGDRMVVRVPFEATRVGWAWRLSPPALALRSAVPTFNGVALDRYAGAAYLIFGRPDTLAIIRARTKAAREYVIAVARKVQRHADAEATTTSLPDLANAIAVPALPEFNPDAEAVPEVAAPAINPDAPALPAGKSGAESPQR